MMKKGKRGFSNNFFLLGVISLLVVGCLSVAILWSHASDARKGRVNAAASPNSGPQAVPVIDQSTPTMIETASFGLG